MSDWTNWPTDVDDESVVGYYLAFLALALDPHRVVHTVATY